MNKFTSLLVLGFALLVVAQPPPPPDRNGIDAGAGTKVDFIGRSGQIRLYVGDDFDVKIKWDKIQEVDALGNNVQNQVVNTFANTDFTWSAPSDVTVNGVRGTTTSLSTVFNVGTGRGTPVNFMVNTTVFQSSVTIQFGNETILVPQNSVKFTINMGAWPFVSTSNKLKFGAVLLSGGKKGPKAPKSKSGPKPGSRERRVGFGIGLLDSASTALVDGVNMNVTTNVGAQTDNALSIEWVFPNFQRSLVYDPSMAVDSTAAESGAVSFSVFSAFVVTLVAMLLF
eukprot:TRINITY_DN433_c0_g2_i4.p1 TRINITY_DN433_c0_g2~~TRINITY_DN433_c0_g2_i4.p1  ORF type:complete len:283 (-),score=125.35 TRINITY_DN433_c0_g2_i4:72-920(-)